MDPKISIGIDNCFALKRWVTPSEWARVIRELGMRYVEGVADLEIEPLLTPKSVHDDWINAVNEQKAKHGVEVVMMYSNDSTYDTAGFAHEDARIRDYYVDGWFDEYMRISAAIGADVGYFVHGVPEEILYDKARYEQMGRNVYDCMNRVGDQAKKYGVKHVALEQMYTPHQPPFTIASMRKLMQQTLKDGHYPLYVTEDVGHHCPFYLRPTEETLVKGFARYCEDGYIPLWLGSRKAQELFTGERKAGRDTLQKDTIRAILEDVEENPHLFSEEKDNDCYRWLRELGCWSPVVHLQQTNGKSSGHAPFSPEANEDGIIHPVKILRALKEAYDQPEDPTMPERCDHIYLIQELYLSTKDIGYQGLHKLAWSTDYLRRFIPRDDMSLSELLEYNKHITF